MNKNQDLRRILIASLAIALVAAACNRGSVDSRLADGDAAMKASRFSDAENAYQDAVKAAPDDPRTHLALGNLYVVEHKQSAAQAEFMKVLDIDPKNAPTHAGLGNLYADQGQYGLAEEQYRAAVALDPIKPDYLLALADVLRKANKPGAAETELRTALGLDPKNAQAHLAMANLLGAETGRSAEASAEYDQARALDPKLIPPAESTASAATPAAPPVPPLAAPGAAPAAAAPAPPAEVASAPKPASVKVKPLNKVFLLTKNSPVYQDADQGSAVVANVKSKKYVHVTGIAGDWLQIKLKDGTTGFIPASAAE